MSEYHRLPDYINIYNHMQKACMEFKLADELRLPQIVVIGDQSAGKSTFLNRLCGFNILPTGINMVTKCMTIIQLRNCAKEETKFILNEKAYPNFKELKSAIEILNAESGDDVSEVPIHVQIFSPSVKNLSMVDLPGMIGVANAKQPDDIVDKINELVETAISNPNAIILAISPASTDLQASNALKLAFKLDPKRERTFPILTKMDTCNESNKTVFEGKDFNPPFKWGIHGICCNIPSNQKSFEDKQDFDETSELNFLQRRFSNVIPGNLAIKNLREKLEKIFCDHLISLLPGFLNNIYQKMKEIEKRIALFGPEFADDDKRNNKNLIEIEKIRKNGKVEFANEGGIKIKEILSKYSNNLRSYDILSDIDDRVLRGFKKCSGGYQPKLFLDQTDTKDLLSRFIKDFKDYSNYTLSLVETELNNLIYKVTLNELAPFKNLRSSILEKMRSVILNQKMVTETIISQHINAHVKDIDFEDPAFIEFMLANNNEDILKKEYGLKLDVKKHTRKNSNPLNLRTFAEIQAINDSLILDDEFKEGEEKSLMTCKMVLRGYMDIVQKDFASKIPKYIRTYFLRHIEEFLSRELTNLRWNKPFEKLLEIDHEKMTEKRELKHRLNLIQECLQHLKDIKNGHDA